jgi:hypothetical protein
MEFLIQYSDDCIENQSIRNLRIFSGYKKIFLPASNSFRHYVVVIGYSGRGCQEECSYVMYGSNPITSKINRAYSSFPTDWEYEHFNKETNEVTIELDEMDKKVFKEFQNVINKYLLYSEEEDCFIINLENEEIIDTTFYTTPKFPIKILVQLNSVYWPFSTSW